MIIAVWSIIKNYRNFFRYTIFWITYAMCGTSIFSCITTKISNFTIFSIFQIFMFFTNVTDLYIFIWFLLLFCQYCFYCVIFLITKLFRAIFTSEYIMLIFYDSKWRYRRHKNFHGKCPLSFVVDEFSRLFLHTSVFSIIHSRFEFVLKEWRQFRR